MNPRNPRCYFYVILCFLFLFLFCAYNLYCALFSPQDMSSTPSAYIPITISEVYYQPFSSLSSPSSTDKVNITSMWLDYNCETYMGKVTNSSFNPKAPSASPTRFPSHSPTSKPTHTPSSAPSSTTRRALSSVDDDNIIIEASAYFCQFYLYATSSTDRNYAPDDINATCFNAVQSVTYFITHANDEFSTILNISASVVITDITFPEAINNGSGVPIDSSSNSSDTAIVDNKYLQSFSVYFNSPTSSSAITLDNGNIVKR